MPTFDTGNAQWDQNLSSLGNALFPDPSKQSLAYYQGAEARKAQLESNRIIRQENSLARFQQMQPDSEQPLAPQTYYQPPLTGAAPIPSPPSNLPSPALSSVVPGPPVAGPPGAGRIVPQTMSPAQAAAQTPASAAPLMRGTPEPTGAPTPGASPQTPQNTGSDGSVPTNDPASGTLHPGSITDPNGGVKISGPAASNGSPARTPVSLATYVAQAAAAGMDASQASLQGQAYLASLYQQGRISRDTYHQLLGGAGQPGLATADTAAASAANVANIGAASAARTTGMVVGGENLRKGMDVTFVPDPNDPSKGSYVPLSQLQGPGGRPAFNPAAVPEATKYGTFTTPGQPNAPDTLTTTSQAAATGQVPVATSQEQQRAALEQRWRNMPPGPDKDRMLQQLIAISTTPKEIPAQQQLDQQTANYKSDQRTYAPPQRGLTEKWGILDPAALDNNVQDLVARRAAEMRLDVARPDLRENPGAARDAAVQDLISKGLIESPAEVNARRVPTRQKITSLGLSGDPRVQDLTPPLKNATSIPHMMVHLTPKGVEAAKALGINAGPASAPAATAPTAPAAPAATAPVAPAAPTGPAPTTALSPTQQYGGTQSGAPPVANPAARLSEVLSAIGRPTNATPLTGPQMYGSQPPAAPFAPAAPSAAPSAAPAQAAGPAPIGRARPGTPDGPGVLPDGRHIMNRAGLIYLQQ